MIPISLDKFCIHLGERITLKPTTLDIEEGSSTVIMGPTGTGKSVFLKSIAGILPTNIFKFEGSLKVNGNPGYFGGKKLDKGAYVEVKVLGSVDSGASSKMTAKVCEILDKELGIPGDAVYVSYFGTSNWGWNGSNF